MTGARLRGSLLQSNASYVTNNKVWAVNDIVPLEWSQNDENTVQYSGLSIASSESDFENYITSCGLSVSASGGVELEYYVQLVSGSSVVSESSWKSVNDIQYVSWDWEEHTLSNTCYIYYYVRRVDKEPLPKSSLYMASVFAYGYNDVPIDFPKQTTAIPPEWLDTTTQTYQTVTTATRPAEYDDLVGTVPVLTPDVGGTPPSWFEQYNPINKPWFIDVLSSLADWYDIVTVVAGQMKIFWVFGGFVVIGLLLAWLLH